MATYQEQLDKLQRQREEREKAETESKARQLTPEQIKHWRMVLVNVVGPGAMLVPDRVIQEFKERFQANLDSHYAALGGE